VPPGIEGRHLTNITTATTPNDDDEQDNDRSFDVPNKHTGECLNEQSPIVLSESTLGKHERKLRLFVGFLHTQRYNKIKHATVGNVETIFKAYAMKDNCQETLRNKLSVVSELYKYIRIETDDADDVVLEPHTLYEMDRKIKKYNTPETMIREGLDREEFDELVEGAACCRGQLMMLMARNRCAE
jgi:integrase/recombinase XerD